MMFCANTNCWMYGIWSTASVVFIWPFTCLRCFLRRAVRFKIKIIAICYHSRILVCRCVVRCRSFAVIRYSTTRRRNYFLFPVGPYRYYCDEAERRETVGVYPTCSTRTIRRWLMFLYVFLSITLLYQYSLVSHHR